VTRERAPGKSVDLTKDHVLSLKPRCLARDVTSAVPAGSTASACDDGGGLGSYRSLLGCLQAVPEPRRRCGIRHRAAVVPAFAVAAVLAGADSVTAVTEWAQDAPPEVLQALDARRDRRGRHRWPEMGRRWSYRVKRCYFHARKPRLAGRICVLICGQRLVCVLVTTPSPPGPKRWKRWPWVVLAGVLALAGAVWFGASWLPLHVRDGVRHDLVFAGGAVLILAYVLGTAAQRLGGR
jgi:hypothetical protein